MVSAQPYYAFYENLELFPCEKKLGLINLIIYLLLFQDYFVSSYTYVVGKGNLDVPGRINVM